MRDDATRAWEYTGTRWSAPDGTRRHDRFERDGKPVFTVRVGVGSSLPPV